MAVIALIVQSVKQRKTVLQNVLREQQREERLQQANKGGHTMNPRRKSRFKLVILLCLALLLQVD